MTDIPAPTVRHDGWTPERQRLFLTHLARFGGVTAAARAAGISAKSAYRFRDRAPAFAAAWKSAQAEGRLASFEQAIDRARNGEIVPVYRNGRLTGVRHRYDNRLAYAACYAQPAPKL